MTTTPDPTTFEGWARPGGALRYHYFRGGISLCRTWQLDAAPMFVAPVQTNTCAECERRRRDETGG